jgi:hypothetical protein
MSALKRVTTDNSMTGKFDNYLTYITRDFQEEKSLEQPGKPFQITVVAGPADLQSKCSIEA